MCYVETCSATDTQKPHEESDGEHRWTPPCCASQGCISNPLNSSRRHQKEGYNSGFLLLTVNPLGYEADYVW